MRKRIIGELVVAIVVFIVVLLAYRAFIPPKVDYFLFEPRDLVESLVSAGRIKLSQESDLAFETPGIIHQVLVEKGDLVHKGQLLASLSTDTEENELELARVEYRLATLRLERITNYERKVAEEEYERAQITRKNAWDEYKRAQILRENGGITEEEFVKAQRNWKIALSQENIARIRWEQLSDQGVEFLEAKAQVEQAHLLLKKAEMMLQRRLLFSPFEGVALARYKNSGEFIQGGETLFTLGQNPFYVVTNLDEREYKKLKEGAKALIREQAEPQRVFSSFVASIAPIIDSESGTVETKLFFESFPNDLKPESAVNVEIILREETGVLAFPQRYLVSQGEKTSIWTIDDSGKTRLLPLQKIERFDRWIITQDLPPQTIILNPDKLKNAQRVTLGERRSE